MNTWKRGLAVLVLSLLALVVAAPAGASHSSYQYGRVKVMSQNLYIGADISRLLAGETPAAVLETVEQTDYPARAQEIARAIDEFNPDIIGLQEVWSVSLFTEQASVFELDFLDILMALLAARGESYAVSSVSTNADVTLPVEPGVFGRVVDSDVILHRTSTTSVSNESAKNFDVNFVAPLGGAAIEFTRGYHMVDAQVRGQEYRFVNTHLEVEDAPCLVGGAPVICQEVQAEELMGALSGSDEPTILVGDLNAEPGSPVYQTVDEAGFLDTWTRRFPYNDEPGFTCCQSELLNNPENQLSKRIDYVFISRSGLRGLFALTTVVGDWDQRKTPSGLWYSDHGGPFADLRLGYSASSS